MCKDSGNSYRYSLVLILLCLVGAWISWQTVEVHLESKFGMASSSGICNISKSFNCQAVAQSSWSEIAGIPLGIYGIVFYLGLTLLLLQSFYSKFWSDSRLLVLYLPALFLSALSSVGLFLISKFIVQALCPLCLVLYLINFLLLLVASLATGRHAGGFHWKVILSEYSLLITNFKRDLLGLNVKHLVEYLLSLGIISVLVLGSVIAFRFAEEDYRTRIVEWPVDQKLPIDLNLEGTIDSDYFIGDLGAPVQIVEFADYQCPFCRHLGSQIKSWLKDYQGQFYLVYLNYPLDHQCNEDIVRPFHQIACDLAELNRCAGEQNKFWEAYHYLVRLEQDAFIGTGDLKKEILEGLSSFAGIDRDLVNECLASDRQIANIQNEIRRARVVGVNSTPTLFINGKRVKNISEQAIRNIMDKVLQKK